LAHDPRQLDRDVIELAVVDHVGLAGGNELLLDVADRHGLGELLGIAAGAERDIDGHVVAGLPGARIDIDPGVAQADNLKLLAVLADGGMQQREDVAHALGHDPRNQLDAHLRGRKHLRDCGQ